MSNLVFEQLGKKLDRKSGSHLYVQVSSFLREKVDNLELKAGDSILPQRELSQIWGISEITVRRAIQDLVREGVLVSRPGSGTFVAPPPWENKQDHGQDRDDVGHERGASAPRASTPGPARATVAGPHRGTKKLPAAGELLRVGVVLHSVTEGYPFFSEVVRGIRAGTEHGCAIQFFEQPVSEDRDLVGLAASVPLESLSGVIFCSPVNVQLLARCQAKRTPHILICNDLTDGFSDGVFVDYASGLLDTVAHLIHRGRKSIALVTAAINRFSTARMVAGYEMALRHFGLLRDERWLVHGAYNDSQGREATQQLLSLGEDRPDAIIFSSDYQVADALVVANEHGLEVPKDLSLVGHGNIFPPQESARKITTLDVHPREIGREAMARLSQRLGDSRHPGRRIAITPELLIGETT